MKNLLSISFLFIISFAAFAQPATEIDPKFVKLPRYANLTAITTAITAPTQGIQVYNIETASNWYYNGATWTNMDGAVAAPLVLNLSSIGGTTIHGIHTSSGPAPAPGGNGVRGESNGGEYGAGVYGFGSDANYGVWGNSPSFYGVYGTGAIGGYFNGTTALRTNGGLQFGGSNVGTPAAGKVLTATDANGNATWQAIPNPVGPLYISTSGLTNTMTLACTQASTTGSAGYFDNTSTENNYPTIQALKNAGGPTAYFINYNSSGIALQTSGGLKFGGSNVGTPAAGKVLTATDANGNAVWQDVPPVVAPLSLTATSGTTLTSASTGSGIAANFSSTSGYALITGAGNVGIGTSTPTAKLEVAGQVKTTTTTTFSIDATNSSSTNATIKAVNNTNLAPALDITGSIKVSGVNKTAFKIVTSATYISGNKFGIVNTTMANASTDILIVTYEYTGGGYLNKQFATFWNGGNWEIHLTDGSAMPVGTAFNILVIKQ